MPKLITCSLCTVEASTADMDLHFMKRHDLSQRYDFYYDKTSIQVQDKECDVLYSKEYDLYRCLVCTSGGNKEIWCEPGP